MNEKEEAIKNIAQAITEQMTDEGKIIEVGWMGFRVAAVPAMAPDMQITEMRKAFFAGASHLFSSIMSVLDPGTEPTDRDLNRMVLIYAELQAFEKQFKDSIEKGN